MRSLSLRFTLASFSLLLAVLSSCVFETKTTDQFAGTSISTGNPGTLKVGFRIDDRLATFTGSIDVYGATQIPIQFFNPKPLASIHVVNAREFSIDALHLSGIPDTIWPFGSREGDSVFRFNLVISDSSRATVLKDFVFLKKQQCLTAFESGIAVPCSVSTRVQEASLSELVSATAEVDKRFLPGKGTLYLFVPGSPYYADADSNGFIQFDRLPKGSHDLSSFFVLKEGIPMSQNDSLTVYRLKPPLNTYSKVDFEVDSAQITVPTPKALQSLPERIVDGTSAEVRLNLKVDGSPADFTGIVELFGSTHIPYPGGKIDPLARLQVIKSSEFMLKGEHFQSVPFAAWPWGSIQGTNEYRFSVVISNSNHVGIAYGFAHLKRENRFIVYDTSIGPNTTNAVLNVELRPKVDFILGAKEMKIPDGKNMVAFLMGTNFSASAMQLANYLQFTIKGVPKGKYPGYLAVYSLPDSAATPTDSTSVYSLGIWDTNVIGAGFILNGTPSPYPRPKGL